MTMVQTTSGDIGAELASAIRDAIGRAVGGQPVATYIEEDSPVGWSTLSDAGWDLAGIVDGPDSADLRDLVEIARAWGEHLIQLPFIPSLLAKRHSPQAAKHDGPVTYSIGTRTSSFGSGLVPFGQFDGIVVLTAMDPDGDLLPVSGALSDGFAPSMRCAVEPHTTVLTPQAAREIATVAAAEAAGVAARAVRDAVTFSKERQQFGKPIGSFQAIKHHMADAHIAAELAETGAIWAALDPNATGPAVTQSLAETQRSLHKSVQIYGGLGFTWEMGLHYSLRHVGTLRDVARGALDQLPDN